jgi:hypothetical protein
MYCNIVRNLQASVLNGIAYNRYTVRCTHPMLGSVVTLPIMAVRGASLVYTSICVDKWVGYYFVVFTGIILIMTSS